MSRITQLTAENVKRLKAVTINPKGNVVVIGGANEQGKSSVLDSIAMLFGGADEIPAMPVRKGEGKAKIVAVLEDGLTIKRTFTEAGGTALVVEAKDGARYPSPQSIVDKLTGKLTFDPLAFTKLESKKQAEALKKLLGLDFTALDASRKKLYDERTLTNQHVARVKVQVASLPHHSDAPAEAVSTEDLMLELEKAQRHNASKETLEKAWDSRADAYNSYLNNQASVKTRIAELEKELESARENLKELDQKLPKLLAESNAAEKLFNDFEPIDEAAIRSKLSGAAAANRKVTENTFRADAQNVLKGHIAAADALTAKIEAIDKDKEAQLAAAKFPIEGLGFTDDGLTYKGIPFSQASSAQQIRVSVAMAAALNPKLRVMLVKDGSLFDEKSMTLLAELAQEHDLQVWVERVGNKDLSAVVIEDGSVVGEEPPAKEDAPKAEDSELKLS